MELNNEQPEQLQKDLANAKSYTDLKWAVSFNAGSTTHSGKELGIGKMLNGRF